MFAVLKAVMSLAVEVYSIKLEWAVLFGTTIRFYFTETGVRITR